MEIGKYKQHVADTSEILKALSHPTRFCIVCKLSRHPLNVTQMQSCLEVPQANVSQHIAVLKSKGIIRGERDGNEIFYSLASDDVRRLIGIFFQLDEIPE